MWFCLTSSISCIPTVSREPVFSKAIFEDSALKAGATANTAKSGLKAVVNRSQFFACVRAGRPTKATTTNEKGGPRAAHVWIDCGHQTTSSGNSNPNNQAVRSSWDWDVPTPRRIRPELLVAMVILCPVKFSISEKFPFC